MELRTKNLDGLESCIRGAMHMSRLGMVMGVPLTELLDLVADLRDAMTEADSNLEAARGWQQEAERRLQEISGLRLSVEHWSKAYQKVWGEVDELKAALEQQRISTQFEKQEAKSWRDYAHEWDEECHKKTAKIKELEATVERFKDGMKVAIGAYSRDIEFWFEAQQLKAESKKKATEEDSTVYEFAVVDVQYVCQHCGRFIDNWDGTKLCPYCCSYSVTVCRDISRRKIVRGRLKGARIVPVGEEE